MSNKEVVCTHDLVVRFEQVEDGSVNWLIQDDPSIAATNQASYEDLAEAGAPLAALASRALSEMLSEGLLIHALEKGNMYLWKEGYRRLNEQLSEAVHDVEELPVLREDANRLH